MIAEDLKRLSMSEKLQIMETLWEDMREKLEGAGIPEDFKKLLSERRNRVIDGTVNLSEWDDIKDKIGKL